MHCAPPANPRVRLRNAVANRSSVNGVGESATLLEPSASASPALIPRVSPARAPATCLQTPAACPGPRPPANDSSAFLAACLSVATPQSPASAGHAAPVTSVCDPFPTTPLEQSYTPTPVLLTPGAG